MQFKRSNLRDAICLVLGAGAAFSAMAQNPPTSGTETEAPKQLDRVQVTGSRIRTVESETVQPVLVIDRQQIEKQGFQSVGDILQNISAVGNPPITRAAPLSAGEAAGGTFISLRNLGAARTLVLVNGRRLGITTSGLADVSTIPAVAIQRIEVLKDGASSIYGSDAIAGVINIITRSNYEGASGSVYYGQYGEGDGGVTKGDFAIGFSGDRGSVTMAAEWGKEDRVRATDREFSAFPRSNLHPNDNWTTLGQYGGFTTTSATQVPGVAAGQRVVLRPGADPRLPSSYVAQNTNTGSCTANSLASPGPQPCVDGSPLNKSNTLEQTDLRTPLETRSLYVDGVFNITDAVRFRANMLYNNRLSSRTVAGYPLQATSPALPRPPVTLSATSYFNPIGADINNWWRRTWEIPRVTDAELNTYRFNGAFEGSFDAFGRTFDWDASYLRNENTVVQSTYGNINFTRLRQATGPSFLNAQGRVQCGTAASPIDFSLCVPFNPFLPFGVQGQGGLTNNQPLRDYLFQEEHSTGKTTTEVIAANITGDLFDLPAGAFAVAFGVENRKESGRFTPDALAVSGESTNLSAGPTRGGYSVNEAYVELHIPLLANIPFAKELSLDIASRFSDFDTFGETTNNKFSLKWRPVDSLMLRATYADGFRAPTIADLYGGGSQTFSTFTDPCDTTFGSAANNATTRQNCINGVGGFGALGASGNSYRQLAQGGSNATAPNAQTPVPFTSGSNPLLTPEISKSQTIGAVWSPTFAEGLNFTLDWWKIRIADTIVADSPTNILNDCYINGDVSRCSPVLFTRTPGTGVPVVTFGGTNAGFRKVEGYDFDVSYRLRTEKWGAFSVVSNSTYTVADYFVSTNAPRIPLSSIGTPGTFRIRSNLNLSWEKGAFGASFMSRYYSKMYEGCTYFTPQLPATNVNRAPPVREPHLECDQIIDSPTGSYVGVTTTPASGLERRRNVGANTFHDVQVRWQAPWNATVAIGANNVFGHIGPVMYTQPASNVPYYGGFDIGRFLYMRYTQRF